MIGYHCLAFVSNLWADRVEPNTPIYFGVPIGPKIPFCSINGNDDGSNKAFNKKTHQYQFELCRRRRPVKPIMFRHVCIDAHPLWFSYLLETDVHIKWIYVYVCVFELMVIYPLLFYGFTVDTQLMILCG